MKWKYQSSSLFTSFHPKSTFESSFTHCGYMAVTGMKHDNLRMQQFFKIEEVEKIHPIKKQQEFGMEK